MKQRKSPKVVVVSDVHLGTLGSRAEELLHYLKSIQPEILVLNGDIIDGWQFKKKYWPVSHTLVLKEVLNLAAAGCKVFYLPGNHDEEFRRFTGQQLGNIVVSNKLILNLDGDKAWFFHGDVFDVTMQHSRWLTKLGSIGYDLLIWINARVNQWRGWFGQGKISFSKKVKNGVKSAVKFINKFEELCADIAIENNYQYVVCGHIHQPEIRAFIKPEGRTTYLNSGDWVENLTALEYEDGRWSIYEYASEQNQSNPPFEFKNKHEIFMDLVEEFQQMNTGV
jgi:UDP-2,3-diacylglucosamine pyrophosphatase LpxH